jgi:hypothetical protein
METNIDHIIPEALLKDPTELANIKIQFGLDASFDLNDYCNWLPSHGYCNNQKNDKKFKPTPVFQMQLDKAKDNCGEVKRKVEFFKSDIKKDKLFAKILALIESDDLTKEEIMPLFDAIEPISDPDVITLREEISLFIPSSWKPVHTGGQVALVTDGTRFAITTTAANPDFSWVCPTCGWNGPWNGVICMSCGRMSDPND